MQILEELREGKLFGYLQCDIEVPGILRGNIANFPPIFKYTLVSKGGIGDLVKTMHYAEEKRLLSQPRKKLISSFPSQNRTLIIPVLLFELQLGLVCPKIHRFVEYSPEKCFNRFVQSVMEARRESDENPNSSVVAKTMKLLANRCSGYQIMDCSQHTVAKYLNDKKNTCCQY